MDLDKKLPVPVALAVIGTALLLLGILVTVFLLPRLQGRGGGGPEATPSVSEVKTATTKAEREAVLAKAKAEATKGHEKKYWDHIRYSGDIDEYEDFLRIYPSGEFAPMAKEALRKAKSVSEVKTATTKAERGNFGQTPFGTLFKVETKSELNSRDPLGGTTNLQPKNRDSTFAILYFEAPGPHLEIDSFKAKDYALVSGDGLQHECAGAMMDSSEMLVTGFSHRRVSIYNSVARDSPITTQLVFVVPKHAGECRLTINGGIVGRLKIPD